MILGIIEYINAPREISISREVNNFKIGPADIIFASEEEINWSEIENSIHKKIGISYSKLKKIIKFRGIKTCEDYFAVSDIRFIKNPESLRGWKNWEDFLGVEYYNIEEIKKLYEGIKIIKNPSETYEMIRREKKDNKIPELRAALEKYSNLMKIIKKNINK